MKKRELFLYVLFGVFTSFLNVLLFYLLSIFIDYKLANIITLIIVKITAYLLNKKYVFKSKCRNKIELFKEVCRFIIWRGFSLLIDYFGLIILFEIFKIDKNISKVVIVFLVIAINYITGKMFVFKKSGAEE